MSRVKQRELDRRTVQARTSGRVARFRSALMGRALGLASADEHEQPFEKLPPEERRAYITTARGMLNRRERRDGGQRGHQYGIGAMAPSIKSKSAK